MTTATAIPKDRWVGDRFAHDEEHARLLNLQAALDPHTTRLLRDEIGVRPGWRCLEAGAGAGSIARWLSDRAGPNGEVVALDMNCRFLDDMPDNVTVIEHRLGDQLSDIGTFDFIHHRAVLNYVSERLDVLTDLVGRLRPRGWILSEECVFTTLGGAGVFHGGEKAALANAAYNGAMRILELAGTDMKFGLELRRLLTEAGLIDVMHDGVTLVFQGSDETSSVVWQVVKSLAPQIEAECGMSATDIEDAVATLRSPTTWYQSPLIMSAWGRRQ